jgi:hypothetical protein
VRLASGEERRLQPNDLSLRHLLLLGTRVYFFFPPSSLRFHVMTNFSLASSSSSSSQLCGAQTGSAHTWEKIAGHSCGKYKEEKEKNADDARVSLQRYMHYYERYIASHVRRYHASQ